MIKINNEISIHENEIEEEFVLSSGPGGQNVNKVATAVQLRFNIKNSTSIPEDVKARLIKLGGNRITNDGTIIIHAKRFRSQEKNRKDALHRLIILIQKASIKPKYRRKTKPSKSSIEKRISKKKKLSRMKKNRKFFYDENE